MSRCVSFAAICFFFVLCAAQNTTESSQDELVGWQAIPTRRGTFDIIQSCFFTILACTWTIQHLNIPSPEDKPHEIRWRKFRWMLLTIFLPEFILAHAAVELDMARRSTRRFREMGTCNWWCSPLRRCSNEVHYNKDPETGRESSISNRAIES
jgi:hypothetical protein